MTQSTVRDTDSMRDRDSIVREIVQETELDTEFCVIHGVLAGEMRVPRRTILVQKIGSRL